MLRFIWIALALALPGLAAAQDADTQEINHYVLTEAGLAKYTAATQKLGALADQLSACDEGEETQSLDEAVAGVDENAAAKAAIQSTGLTTREYLVFGMAAFQSGMAAWALSQPGGKLPPGVTMANVKFYRDHEAEIQDLNELTTPACDSGDEEEAPEEN